MATTIKQREFKGKDLMLNGEKIFTIKHVEITNQYGTKLIAFMSSMNWSTSNKVYITENELQSIRSYGYAYMAGGIKVTIKS